jgi:hypothetical protein
MYKRIFVRRWLEDHIAELVVLGTLGFMVLVAGVLIYANLTSGYHMGGCYGVGCP